ncbi:hypothetical protein DIPPA_18878 [Diplonema papillatum]|nr:hypothetical protein DIPPA_18878 [Diplonema papillatum]
MYGSHVSPPRSGFEPDDAGRQREAGLQAANRALQERVDDCLHQLNALTGSPPNPAARHFPRRRESCLQSASRMPPLDSDAAASPQPRRGLSDTFEVAASLHARHLGTERASYKSNFACVGPAEERPVTLVPGCSARVSAARQPPAVAGGDAAHARFGTAPEGCPDGRAHRDAAEHREPLVASTWREIDELERKLAEAQAAAAAEQRAHAKTKAELREAREALSQGARAHAKDLAALRGQMDAAARRGDTDAMRAALEDDRLSLRQEISTLHSRVESLVRKERSLVKENGALKQDLDRASRRATRSVESAGALDVALHPAPAAVDHGQSTEGLIDIIKNEFLVAGRKGCTAEAFASELKKTARKIALLTAENERLQQKLAKANESVDAYRRECDTMQRARQQAVQELASQTMNQEATRRRLVMQQEASDDTKSSDLVQARADSDRYRLQVAELRAELEGARAKYAAVAEELNTERTELASTSVRADRAEVAEAKAAAVHAALTTSEAARQSLQDELAGEKQAAAAAQARADALQSSLDELKEARRVIDREHSALRAEMQECKAKLGPAESKAIDLVKERARSERLEEEVVIARRQAEERAERLVKAEAELDEARRDVDKYPVEKAKLLERIAAQEGLLHERTSVLTRERGNYEMQLSATQAKVAELAPKITSLEAENRALHGRVADKEELIASLSTASRELEDRLRSLQNNLEESLSRAEHLEAQNAQYALQTHDLSADYKRAHEELISVTSKYHTTQALQSTFDILKAETTDLRKQLTESKTQVETHRRELLTTSQQGDKEVSRLSRELELAHMRLEQENTLLQTKLETQAAHYKETSEMLRDHVKQLSQERDQARAENTACTDALKTSQENAVSVQEDLRQAMQKLRSLEQDLAAERTQLSQANSRVASLREQVADERQNLSKREVEVKELIRGLHQQAEVSSQATEKRNALETQIREIELALQKEKTTGELVDKQRRTEVEDLHAKIRRYEEELDNMQSNLLDMDHSYRAVKHEQTVLLEERRKEHETVLDPLREKVEKQRRELHTLKEKSALADRQAESHQKRANELYCELTDVKVAKAALEVEKEEALRRLSDARQSLDALTKESSALEATLRQAQQQLERTKTEKEVLQARLQDSSSKASGEQMSLSAALQEAKKERSEFKARLDALDSENRRLVSELEDATATGNRYKKEFESLQEVSRNTARVNQRFSSQLLEVQTSHETSKLAHGQASARLQDLEVDYAATVAKLAELREENRQSDRELGEKTGELRELSAERDILLSQLADRDGELAELRSSNAMLEATCAQYNKEAEDYRRDRADLASVSRESLALKEELASRESAGDLLEKALEREGALTDSVLRLTGALQEEKAKGEALARSFKDADEELRAVRRDLSAARDASDAEQSGLASKHTAAVHLQATILAKLREFILDAATVSSSPPAEGDVLNAVPGVAARWMATPQQWDADEAQRLFTRLLSIVMRHLTLLKQLSQANAGNRSSRTASPLPLHNK